MTQTLFTDADKQALVDRLNATRNELLAIVRDLPADFVSRRCSTTNGPPRT